MKPFEKLTPNILNDSTELRKLIAENPDLPILCFAGSDCNNGEFSYMCCSAHAVKGEVLNCTQPVYEERIFTDREEFEDRLRDYYDEFDGSDAEFDQFIENELVKYDPYWTPCIILYVDN